MADTLRTHEGSPPAGVPEVDVPHRADGPGAAAMLAAGIGLFALGLFTILNEVSTTLHDWFESWDFGQGVGPLAGKTTLAVIVWVVAWVALHLAWRRRDVPIQRMFWVGLALGILGAIGTFPPFFTAFPSE